MTGKPLFLTAIVSALLMVPVPALAHAKLVSSTPAAGATAAKPTKLTLTFSETLIAQLSGVDIVMTGMPGMSHHAPMKVGGFASTVSPDGKTLVVTLPRALPAGTYEIDWHAVTSDGHRMEGKYNISVK